MVSTARGIEGGMAGLFRGLLFTMGDVGGIGPEVLAETVRTLSPMGRAIVIYGSASVWTTVAPDLLKDTLVLTSVPAIPNSPITLVDPGLPTEPGHHGPSAINGAAAFRYLEMAVESAKRLSAPLVTAPISKTSFRLAQMGFTDHTSYLADACGCDVRMGFYADALKVVLVTIHIALSEVPSALTQKAVSDTILAAHQFGLRLGFRHPRIAVAGLNPHAGEMGLIGDDEERIITPAIQIVKAHGIQVDGPFPPDTVFRRAHLGEFDIVVAQYHDQGLIPLKLLAFDSAVNITLGLPFVRTSPDHGTAFDIAGQGVAHATAMTAATHLALKLSQ